MDETYRAMGIRILPDETGQGRVRAEYGGRRTAWPECRPVTLAEIITEFADLLALPDPS